MESAMKDFRKALVWDHLTSAVLVILIPGLCSVLWQQLQRLQVQRTLGRSLIRRVRRLAAFVDPDLSVTIAEHESTGRMMRPGDVYYEEAKAYISDSCSRTARHLRAEGSRGDAAADRLQLSMLDGEEVADEFRGVTVFWSAHTRPTSRNNYPTYGGAGQQERYFELHYHRRHRELVLGTYLYHVRQKGRDIMVKNRQRKLFSVDRHGRWIHLPFKHPMKFNKLAMDPAKKKEIMNDLDAFKNGKERYERVGKAWKRGYLLYGPPGTGKSTMIVAMANHLEYDVYTIELTSVKSNTDLQNLMIEIKSKAIIVIEDIDCSLDLTGARGEKKKRAEDNAGNDDEKKGASTASNAAEADTSRSKVTLSGLLNVVDGLPSACSEERIIVFTTNHLDKLDKALIRRGRMDKHIEMSSCCFEAFKSLAATHLGVDAESHTKQFETVQKLLVEVNMTPADVIENLTVKSLEDNPDSCLAALVKALEEAKEKANRGSSA
ncbi:AAA-ATPase ASD, mitochondrial [Dichanthelium oligosanthes]|uniref:AAA-ATPase ASD, mitochondrial n=1 Tax=Dichanthelium oligosanthes TaxID=888268 RepID=A0A1E5VCK6_9POAL|nr:AAA-ATPase ASD, mitochondrial [Dichanthelium oligosanthes]